MNNPLITIILPVYNGSRSLKKAIESVLAQSYIDWELLIINDGSSDNSEEIALDFVKNNTRVKYVKNSNNQGVQKTRNIALEMVKGEYVAEIDQDDEWLDKNKLAKQIEFLKKNKDYVLVGTGVVVVGEDGSPIARYLMPETDTEIRNKILRMNPFIHSSVMYPTKIIKDVGGYTIEKMSEDHDLWLRIGRLGKFKNLPEYSVKYLYSPKGYNSQDKFIRLKQNLLFIKEHKDYYPNYFQALILGWGKILFYPIFKYAPLGLKGILLKFHKKL